MKKRIKKKLKKKNGYKRYDNFRVYKHALTTIKVIQKIINEDISNIVTIYSKFKDFYSHRVILSNHYPYTKMNCIDSCINIYILEIEEFKPGTRYPYSKRGELFYNIITNHRFETDKTLLIFGDLRYNNSKKSLSIYDDRLPDNCTVEFVANHYVNESVEKLAKYLKENMFNEGSFNGEEKN